jgi:ABC-2 type transport system ATP-binding protein
MRDHGPVIQTHGLSKAYGTLEALRDLNLSIGGHQITAFLGQNGAGKSTAIKCLLGMMRPSAGEANVLGWRVGDREADREIRQRVAFVAENKPLYSYMTVEEMVRFTGSFYPDWRPKVATNLLKESRLPLDMKIKALSKGMRTKLALLLAVARKPDLLILDEPTEGLDPVGIEQFLRMLVNCVSEGTTVFFSSHQISEVERIADHICILDQGHLKVDVSMDDLRQSYRQVDLVFPDFKSEADLRVAGMERIQINGRQIRIFTSKNTDVVVERAQRLQATSIEVNPVGLREVFLEAVREG